MTPNPYQPAIPLSDTARALYDRMMAAFMDKAYLPEAPGYAAADGINTLATFWSSHAVNGAALHEILHDADEIVKQVQIFKHEVGLIAFDDALAAAKAQAGTDCECDNTHEAASTTCLLCWHRARRDGYNDDELKAATTDLMNYLVPVNVPEGL